MYFLISHTQISLAYLVGLGFLVGILGGFFGVGGSFLAGPALFALGLPMNYVVGTDLAHIVGKSIVAARRHHALGNVDIKLGAIMMLGTLAGVEVGAQGIEYFKRHFHVDMVVGIAMITVLVCISAFTGWESWKSRASGAHGKSDRSAVGHISKAIQRIHLSPMLSLPVSGIPQISLWVIVLLSFISGVFSGFLGGGAGYIRMPFLVYLLGVPTHVAVGTDLFEIIVSAGYGTLTHALKGNVDIMIALVMHTGAALGAQIGALTTERFTGPNIRMAFVPLPLVGAAVLAFSLLTGSHGK